MTTVPMDSEKLKDMRFDVAGVESVARDVLVMIPFFIEAQLDYNIRGGFHTVTRAQHCRANLPDGMDLGGSQPVVSDTPIDWAAWRQERGEQEGT